MKTIEKVDMQVVQRHERACESNATIGSYDMDKYCPLNEFETFSVTLDELDIERLFLLGEFAKRTRGRTGKVKQIRRNRLSGTSQRKILSFIDPSSQSGKKRLDLRHSPNLALVVVSTDVEVAPLIIIDGNHRAIAQFLTYNTMDDVPVYVGVHPKINQWPYVPHCAR